MTEAQLNQTPYSGTNNRKMTLARLKAKASVQSIRVYEKDEGGKVVKFLGYKYINH